VEPKPNTSHGARKRRPLTSKPSPVRVSTPPIRIIGSEPRYAGGFCLADR
jgi:hypothetical protein